MIIEPTIVVVNSTAEEAAFFRNYAGTQMPIVIRQAEARRRRYDYWTGFRTPRGTVCETYGEWLWECRLERDEAKQYARVHHEAVPYHRPLPRRLPLPRVGRRGMIVRRVPPRNLRNES